MADKIYITERIVSDTEIDFTSQMTLQALLTLFQDIAGAHANTLGLGFEELREKSFAWVLAKTYVKIYSPPTRGQKMRITTWPGTTKRCFYPRYFTIHDEDGLLLCACSSLWVIIDIDTRSLFVDREGILSLPNTSELASPVELPKRLKIPETPDITVMRSPQYSEIDVNNHLNNAKYASWLCDMAGIDVFKTNRISEFYIVYSNEIRPNDIIALSQFHAEDGNIFCGVNQNDLSCFQAQIHWQSMRHDAG